MIAPRRRVVITGIAVDCVDSGQTLEAIEELVAEPKPHYMAVVNAAKMVAAQQDSVLRGILDSADLVTADGMSVVWAARLIGKRLPGRVTGIDMLSRLIEWAARSELSVFFLGATEEAIREAVDRLKAAHPDLRVAGFRNGYFEPAQSKSIAESIRMSGADLLFVGMGSPAQEKWISANITATGVRFALGVGGSFDHVSGRVARAPLWMQRAGLEWLHRLAREPRRMWRRYLVGNTKFILLVARQRLLKR